MFHSVLIPHRDRNDHLGLCLWALDRSARRCGISDWEVVVVDCGSREKPSGGGGTMRVIVDPEAPAEFNKSRAYNLAIDAARGDVVTFLDADAIVASRFLDVATVLATDASVDRCCYRVRYLPGMEAIHIQVAEDRDAYVDELFSEYESYRKAVEFYGRHDRPDSTVPANRRPFMQAWGNSQFSVRRADLAGLRFDEEIGWGMEDMDFNMQLEARFGDGYRGVIATDSEHAMLHLEHPERAWREDRRLAPKIRMYRDNRKRIAGR